MEVQYIANFRINLVYSYMRSQGVIFDVKNEIVDKVDLFNNNESVIKKQKINFHHTKLARRALIAKNDNFDMISNPNKSDLFDANLCNYILPFVISYANTTSFKEFYLNEIKPIELKQINEKRIFIEEGINACLNVWNVKPPKKLIIVNNALRGGGYLAIIGKNERVISSINFFTPFDNMIMYLAIHEFSHYFQNKLFEKLEDEINKKEYLFSRKNEDYSEWKSWLAENVIEAVIFTLIRPPPAEKYSQIWASLNKKYDLTERIVECIKKNKFKKIGLEETLEIIDSL